MIEHVDSPQVLNPSARYVAAMERLVTVVRELSHAHDLDAITRIVREAARGLTGADGATFILKDRDQCYYVEENAIAPLWKGRRFPMSACVSGWVMNHAKPAMIEDIYADPRVPTEAYRPTFVKSLAMVPVRRNAPIGAIGNYWAKRHQPSDEDLAILQGLADTTSVAIENAGLYVELQKKVVELEESQARLREQHGALEVFTRAMAHDLKEPVRSLISYTRLVREGSSTPEKTTDYLGYIQNAADRMGMLIDSVFQFMQLDDPARTVKEPCPMLGVFDSVKQNLAQLIRERGATVNGHMLPTVQAHPTQITQVLQNLIANAIRHNDRPVTVQVRAEDQGDSWRFSVRDDGCGIATENLGKVLHPFKRLTPNAAGAGLGLAICEKIVSRHGGTIWCESQSGHGATFYFTLPKPSDEVVRKRTEGEVLHPAAPAAETALACLLLVDDRPDDLELTALMLSTVAKLQCRVLTARGAEEALAILTREPVDLMLLDINMPGMDGFDLLEHMRKDNLLKNMAVVMCTGSTYDRDRERAQALGAQGYLVKPPEFGDLKHILERLPGVVLHDGADGRRLVRAAGGAWN